MALRFFGCVVLLVCLAWLSGSPGEAFAQAQDPGVLPRLQADLNRVVARIKPSVVCVKAQKRQTFQGGGEMWFESIGSGIVVDGRGYILTNSHVVRGGEKIMVGFWTQGANDFAATIVDEDPAMDLALLRVDTLLPVVPARLGNSSALQIGDYIVSVGSPYGYEHSATFGIISGLHRDLMIGGAAFTDMIQTDATINQGNSGGPLLDLSGDVVGISVAIYSPDKAYTGVGFAIPVNRAKQFVSRTTGAIAVQSPQAPGNLAVPGGALTPAATGPAPLTGFLDRPGATPAVQTPAQAVVQATGQVLGQVPGQTTSQPPLPPLVQAQAPQPAMTPLPAPAAFAGQPAPAVQSPLPAGQTPGQSPALEPGWQPMAPQAAPAAQTPQQSPPQAEPQTAPLTPAALAAPVEQTPAPPAKKPVDLNMKMPTDATHEKFSDCLRCHTILKKMVANMQTPMPHPPLGDCSVCHVLVNEKVAQGPTPVAWNTTLARISGTSTFGPKEFFLIALILLATFATTVLRLDAGLLFVPILYFFGFDIGLAASASLVMLAVTGLSAMVRNEGANIVDLPLIGAITPPAAVAAFAGGVAAAFTPPDALALGLGAALLLAAVFCLHDPTLAAAWGGRESDHKYAWRTSYHGEPYALDLIPAFCVIFAAAFAGGMLGVGGGWLLTPLLMVLFRMPLGVTGAVGLVMTPLVGLSGFLGHIVGGGIKLPLILPMCLAASVGALLGIAFTGLGERRPVRMAAAAAFGLIALGTILKAASVI
jgi:S1-C subfamily serine protease/uncharacterized membrane protein YfcA